jgi:predicted site-specific integrase-resolvase|tara:strand:+ start:646 stop:831 length:186 start_codon:yes stop_codon:yes gene_type:complete
MIKNFLTPKEVSEALKVSEKTLANHRSLGTGLPFVKWEGVIRYPKDSITKFLNDHLIGVEK